MLKFCTDVFSWIPQPEVSNPLYDLPGGVARWGPGISGPFFGGDNFFVPPAKPTDWPPRTYRAMQSFEFQVRSFGDAADITSNLGVRPGTTTVLTAKRSAGGRVCYSMTATVKASRGGVEWSKADGWYEIRLKGAAQDPVPTAVAGKVLGHYGRATVSALTPDLEWDLKIRFQEGRSIAAATRLRYEMSSAFNLDSSGRIFPTLTNLGGSSNLVHGMIMVRRFPSYVVYVSIDRGSGSPATAPIYFADAHDRALGRIVYGGTDVLRQLTW